MSRVLTFSRTYPSYHPKAGQPTYFVEKVWESIYLTGDNPIWLGENYTEITSQIPGLKSIGLHSVHQPKHHTIRAGHRWKAGDWFSPRVWSGKPYKSKMIQFAPDIQVKKVWDLQIKESDELADHWNFFIDGKQVSGEDRENFNLEEWVKILYTNDGLNQSDFINWFANNIPFDGQIICWNESIEY